MAILTALLLTSACNRGGGSDSDQAEGSVDSDGNCTSGFVHDYNMTLIELRSVAGGYGNVQTARNACAKFIQNHGTNVTCNAEVSYQTTTINASNITNACTAL